MAGRRPQWGLLGSRHEQGGLLWQQDMQGVGMSREGSHTGRSTSALLQGSPSHMPLRQGPCSPLLSSCTPPPHHPCCVSFAARLAQVAPPKSQNVRGGLLPSNPIPPSVGSCLPSRIGLTTSLAPSQSPCPLQSCPEDQMIPPG